VYDGDALRDRLIDARTSLFGNGQYTQTFGYDLAGNIITRTASALQTYFYKQPPAPPALPPMPHKMFLPLVMWTESYGAPPPATLHQPFAVISTTAGFRAAYDANGNMLSRVEVSGTQRITYTQQWNAENQLSVVTSTVNSAVTRFAYDGDGKRVLQTLPNGSRTVYVGPLEVSITGTQRLTKTYYAAGAQMVAMRVVSSTGNVLYFIHGDHLGSASLTTNASGAPTSQLRYLPYGAPRPGYPTGNVPTAYRFTGQRSEEATLGSLYDYGARMYSPVLGRFLSADTIVPSPGKPQSLNRYAYTLNNPLKFVDPTGHMQDCPDNNCGIPGTWTPPPQPPSSPEGPTAGDWVDRFMPDGVTLSFSFNASFMKPQFGGEVDIVWDRRTWETVVFASPTESAHASVNAATGFPGDNPASSLSERDL
jgi:RHS repeat-associated protein